jgi:hypothetical protein
MLRRAEDGRAKDTLRPAKASVVFVGSMRKVWTETPATEEIIIIIIMYSAKHLYCAARQPITPSKCGVAVLNHVTNAPGMSE